MIVTGRQRICSPAGSQTHLAGEVPLVARRCGVRVVNVEEPTMREIRYLDKLAHELARRKAMDKIPRGSENRFVVQN